MLGFTSHPSSLLLLFSLSLFFLSTTAKTSLFHSLLIPDRPFSFFISLSLSLSLLSLSHYQCFYLVFKMGRCFLVVFFFSDGVEVDGERNYNELLSWETRRSMEEDAVLPNASLILAQKRTSRKDPLDNFNRYIGGWNISNNHYIAVSFHLKSL